MHSSSDHSGIVGRDAEHLPPLAVTVGRASKLSGLGLTSIWAALRDGRLEAVRVPGIRRTLISYVSLTRLLSPPSDAPTPRRLGRPRKTISADVRRRLNGLTSRS